MDHPRLSVITPTFNSEKHLEACVLSVAQQSYANKEHLIIDNLLTDGTLEILRQYSATYPHIRFISEKDNGIYDAMNKGISLSEGKWLYFLGSDDCMFNEHVVTDILTSPEADVSDIIYGNVQWGENGWRYDGEFSSFKLIEKNICHQAIFYRRDIFERLGTFDTKYPVLADWAFNMQCFGNKDIQRTYKDIVIAVYAPNGYSSKKTDTLFFAEKKILIRKCFPERFVTMLYFKQLQNKLVKLKQKLRSLYKNAADQVIRLYKNLREKRFP